MRRRHRPLGVRFIEPLEQRLVFAAVGVAQDLGVQVSEFIDVNGTVFPDGFRGRKRRRRA
jgi:hypothetical protein